METTKNKLPENTKLFFNKLSEYLDTKLLYFGSIQRSDYIDGKSDIDIDIFTDNESSMITKMQHFLHVNKADFQKFIWSLDNKHAYGYKLKYENTEEKIKAEFSIYNEKFKDIVLEEHSRVFIIPLYISILLYFIKLLYYQIGILPGKIYVYFKRKLLNDCMGAKNAKFVVLN